MWESVDIAVKRVSGSALESRRQNSLFAEAALKVAAYDIQE